MDERMTRAEAQARYEAEIAAIRASGETHPQAISMAMNEARRWLDRALDQALPDGSAATLGERLKHNIAEAERLRLAKLEREQREARERELKHRREVSDAFDTIRRRIAASIEEGSIPAPMRLPKVLDNKTSRWDTPLTSPNHSDHAQWQEEMAAWAQREGLELSVVGDHDGGGMESWWNLVVRPR
jgi:hypothetical protein